MASLPLLASNGDPAHEEDASEDLGTSRSSENKRGFRSLISRITSFFAYRQRSYRVGRVILETTTPSFLHAYLFPSAANTAPSSIPERVSDTAYLDGLRGLASLSVYFSHVSGYIYKGTLYGYGVNVPPDSPFYDPSYANENWYIFQLPVIKMPMNASMMVNIFFVISGFALSVAPLKHIHDKDLDKTIRSISSSLFRRPMRLFLPTFIATLIPFVMLRLHMYDGSQKIFDDRRLPNASHFWVPIRFNSFWRQAWAYISDCWSLVLVCGTTGPHRLNGPTWTIPLEFQGSVYLYMIQLGTSCLTVRIRAFIISSLIIIGFFNDQFTAILFWGGFLIAELDNVTATLQTKTGCTPFHSKKWKIFLWILVTIASYLGSWPFHHGDITPGFIWLSRLIPANYSLQNRFWEMIAAVLMVGAISRLQILKNLLTKRPIRYLGYISFSLYLLHMPLVTVFGVRLMAFFYLFFDFNSDFGCFVGFILSLLIMTPLLFWMADLFTRWVDVPCTRFGRTFEKILLIG